MKKVVFQKWQLKKLIFWVLILLIPGSLILSYTTWTLYSDKAAEEDYWQNAMAGQVKDEQYVEKISKNATHVKTGSYVESIKQIDMKNSSFRVVSRVWFKWYGDDELDMANNFGVYNGNINSITVLADKVEDDGMHYQLCALDVSVFKNFWTKRFPLESHQLRFYIEPNHTINRVILEVDGKNCSVNPSLSSAGYELKRFDNAIYTNEYTTTYGEPGVKKAAVTSEFMTQVEINRDSFGLYLKCFIALFGTSLWVFITLFICTFHQVDPLSMIPAALFGTVSNIMVGANLLPDALETGLLEYVNIWGVMTILAGAFVIININRVRNKYKDNRFAALYGRIVTFILLFIVVMGHILMPVAAYIW